MINLHRRHLSIAFVGTLALILLASLWLRGFDTPKPEPPGTPLKGESKRDLQPSIDDATFSKFSKDNREFAFAFFNEVRANEDDNANIFFSPHSISSALAMAYAGARGNTRDEMARALRFSIEGDDLHRGFNKLDLELHTRPNIDARNHKPPELAVANQLWGDTSLDFVPEYLNILSEHYGADMRAVDFRRDHESTRQDINAWVEARTHDRICDLLPEKSLSEYTRFVLVNAIYFNADWKIPFNKKWTAKADFHPIDGPPTATDMMQSTATYGYSLDDDTVAVSLPYVGDDLSMVAWMPADKDADFLAWEAKAMREGFDTILERLRTIEVVIFLPRFKLEQTYKLSEVFEQMGMIDAFDKEKANFRRVARLLDNEILYLSEIFHKSFVDVDEEGTEAAAATAVVGELSEELPPPPPVVRFDRPFYFAIYDHPTDTILFLGRFMKP